MTKRDLIALLAERLGLPRKTIQAMLAELERLAGSELRKRRAFEIPDLVLLSLRQRKARMGRNPAMGQAVPTQSATIGVQVRMRTAAPVRAESVKGKATRSPASAMGAREGPRTRAIIPTRAKGPAEPPGQVVRVHYGTDREPGKKDGYFADVRGEDLSVGWCDVAIPKDHRLAVVERPSWTLGNWTEDPDKHFVIVTRHRESDARAFGAG